MEELLGMLGLGGGGLLTGQAYNKLDDMGGDAMNLTRGAGQEAIDQGNFTGYGVTGGGVGNANVDAGGNTQFNLSQGGQDQASLFGNASTQMAQSATGDPSQMQDDIYSRIRAMQQPGEQRDQLNLENRLQNQGRLGVQSNMYGGTPEQFSMDKANAEARNSAAYQSIGQAQTQQAQDANMSQMFGQMQYSPLDQLRQNMAAGNQGYGFKDISGRQNQNIMAESLMGGVDAKLAARLGQANLMGELGSSMIGGGAGMFSSAINNGLNSVGDLGGNIWDSIFG